MKGYRKLRKIAIELLKKGLSDKLSYHGYEHTMAVLKQVNFYIRYYNLSSHEAQLLRIATLFHDIGFVDTYKDHEEKSAELLKDYMNNLGCDPEDFQRIKGMIMATRLPQNPKNILEFIICDSDLDYLGRGHYYEIGETLYEEWKAYDMIGDRDQWLKIQINFLKAHSYHTEYAREKLQPGKEKRIAELVSQLDSIA